MRRLSQPSCIALALLLGAPLGVTASSCAHAAQTYSLMPHGTPNAVGSLSVERIEGGQRLVVLQFAELPPPERMGPGVREFVVWLVGPHGEKLNVGPLRYDREQRSGNLLATTDLPAFTIRVTGERDAQAAEPSGAVLAERRVVTN